MSNQGYQGTWFINNHKIGPFKYAKKDMYVFYGSYHIDCCYGINDFGYHFV